MNEQLELDHLNEIDSLQDEIRIAEDNFDPKNHCTWCGKKFKVEKLIDVGDNVLLCESCYKIVSKK